MRNHKQFCGPAWSACVALFVGFSCAGCWTGSRASTRSGSERWENVGGGRSTTSGKADEKEADPVRAKTSTQLFLDSVPPEVRDPKSDVEKHIFEEYGAVFAAKGGAAPPKKIIFKDEAEVSAYQTSLSTSTESIGGISIELQSPAMRALKEAIEEAKRASLAITPRGKDAARRNYTETEGLWKSRVDPGLTHWSQAGRISSTDAQRIRSLSAFEQVPEIFRLESQGIYFSRDLSKSIIYSVAPPGTSQHLAMLALDVSENEDSKVREILANHGWFQTVISDLPHFTYLGVAESELPGLGLKKASQSGRTYWVPNI